MSLPSFRAAIDPASGEAVILVRRTDGIEHVRDYYQNRLDLAKAGAASLNRQMAIDAKWLPKAAATGLAEQYTRETIR